MIIRKDNLKLVSVSDIVLNSEPKPFIFDGKIDPVFLSNVLFDRMQELGGIGLSANQVGLNLSVFIMGNEEARLDIFNPTITGESKEKSNFNEGCLSFPGITLDIKRPISIEVEYFNNKGEKIETYLTGLTARIFQHEYDHMLGKTFKDHVSPMKWAMAVKKFKHKKEKIVKKHAAKIAYDMLKDVQNNASEVSR